VAAKKRGKERVAPDEKAKPEGRNRPAIDSGLKGKQLIYFVCSDGDGGRRLGHKSWGQQKGNSRYPFQKRKITVPISALKYRKKGARVNL